MIKRNYPFALAFSIEREYLFALEPSLQTYDLGIAWSWEYDSDFVHALEKAAHATGITTYFVERRNIEETFHRLKHQTLQFHVIFDRASDEEESFHPLAHEFSKLRQHSIPPLHVINPYDLLKRASDKATMHLELMASGIHVPYTIIISPYNHKKEVELSLTELAKLGRPFIIKPANTTGGGIGVVVGAESLKDIVETRQHHKNDKYLLQEAVKPGYLSENRGWFRVFYAFGSIILCWWDDQTHVYEEVTPEEEAAFELYPLRSITSTIQRVCQLDFFSTEIVFTRDQQWVVVDYVNEICDMRLQSKFRDGVPDHIVDLIAQLLVDFVAKSKLAHHSPT